MWFASPSKGKTRPAYPVLAQHSASWQKGAHPLEGSGSEGAGLTHTVHPCQKQTSGSAPLTSEVEAKKSRPCYQRLRKAGFVCKTWQKNMFRTGRNKEEIPMTRAGICQLPAQGPRCERALRNTAHVFGLTTRSNTVHVNTHLGTGRSIAICSQLRSRV